MEHVCTVYVVKRVGKVKFNNNVVRSERLQETSRRMYRLIIIIIIIINKVLIKVMLNKVIAGALYIVICG